MNINQTNQTTTNETNKNKEQEIQKQQTKEINDNNNNKNKRGPSTCIRFTDEQYKELKELSRETGKSIPNLFKEAFYKRKPARPLMHIDVARKLIGEFNRIGGNVNQIARKMNSGIYEGWYPMFGEFYQQHTQLFNLVANYGKGKR